MVDNTPQPGLIDDHVFLIGRPPLGEYLGFLTSRTVDGEKADLRKLTDEWRSANDHIKELEKREAGAANTPPVEPIPLEFSNLLEKVLADPIFQRSFNIVPTTVGVVELDTLVVFQKDINLNYVLEIQRTLGSKPTGEEVFKKCLPYDHPAPTVDVARIAQNAYMFISPSSDLRFLESVLLGSRQIIDHAPSGPVAGVVALFVGFGSNFLNAIEAEGRLVLNNGSHRAFALREMGVTHVPCLIQHVSRREELAVVTSGDFQATPDIYLKEARPPMLKDYFDPKLRKLVKVSRSLRQVKVAFGIEQVDVPAARQ